MTTTFASGQFFHPYYGWFDKEPDLPNYNIRSGLVNEKIGPEHLITPDHPKYETFLALRQAIIEQTPDSRMAQILAQNDPAAAVYEEPPAYVYEPADLSYYLDGKTKFAGSYSFEYKGNTVTAVVNFNPDGYNPVDIVRHYEEHRASILDLKKQGFHDDAVNMLLKALDDAFINARSGGLEIQITNFDNYNATTSYDKLRDITKALFQEYLRVRGGADSIQIALTIAGNSLVNRGLLNAKVNVSASDSRKVGQSQETIASIDRLDAAWAASPANIPKPAPLVLPPSDSAKWDEVYSSTHIRDLDRYIPDYSKNPNMSDTEIEARSSSIIFRVRGNQMIDYARRYEEISTELDKRLSNGEISASDRDRYNTDLNSAFTKTYNLNIIGQAMAAGLSENKATELAIAFSEEYIKIREQTAPNERNADKIAHTALQKLAAQGWPSFSLYTSENRATVAADDPWYAMMAENTLYWRSNPETYLQYSNW